MNGMMENLLALGLTTLVSAFVGSYLASYLKKKGENLATHEDIDKLVDQVRAVTTATKEIEERIESSLTGFNRFGLFGVTFLVSWICISVPFCAPTCMFSTKGKLHTKKNRGHDRPLRVDSTDLMAEREGFEPPIALRLCLISSQVHSTGLCHLSAVH
jgi:hypothetical protein